MCKKFRQAYNAARKNGWLKDYVWFIVIGGKAKPILQYTNDGRLVKWWESATRAGKDLGIRQNCICECCKGKRKSAYGFVWKYADEAIPA